MTEEHEPDTKTPNRGRTWADVFVGATYITGGLLFLVILALAIYYLLGEVPDWFFLSIIASVLFVPFLIERAKDGSELFLITDQPFKLTEYRIGKKVGLNIDGVGTRFQSKTGIQRMVLTDFDKETKKAKGSPFGGLTQIDQVSDMSTLSKMTEMLEKTLKESRISAQTVGVEVEKQSIQIVDWALKTIYGAIIPSEVSEAFGIDEDAKELEVASTDEEVLEDLD